MFLQASYSARPETAAGAQVLSPPTAWLPLRCRAEKLHHGITRYRRRKSDVAETTKLRGKQLLAKRPCSTAFGLAFSIYMREDLYINTLLGGEALCLQDYRCERKLTGINLVARKYSRKKKEGDTAP